MPGLFIWALENSSLEVNESAPNKIEFQQDLKFDEVFIARIIYPVVFVIKSLN